MKRTLAALLATIFTVAPSDAGTSAFQPGTRRITATLGAGSSYGGKYLIFGLGAGYYVLDGLGAGVDLEGWFFDEPRVWRISPEIHYVMTQVSTVQPYAGGFYRRSFVDGLEDHDVLGARGGVMFRGAAYWVGLGLVWERYLDCDEAVHSRCSETYPEARFTFLL